MPVSEFTEVIEPDLLYPVSQQLLAQSQPVLDPYAVDGLRQAAMRVEDSQRRIKGLAQLSNSSSNARHHSMPPLVPPIARRCSNRFKFRLCLRSRRNLR